MVRLKIGCCAASHNPENRRDRPLSWSKDGGGHEDFHVLPHGSRKDWGKDPNPTFKGLAWITRFLSRCRVLLL